MHRGWPVLSARYSFDDMLFGGHVFQLLCISIVFFFKVLLSTYLVQHEWVLHSFDIFLSAANLMENTKAVRLSRITARTFPHEIVVYQ